jgi:4a-hydroxytetrahydrobiopterin dehydratase
MKKLSEAAISHKLETLEKWRIKEEKWIERRYRFKDYLEGIRFVNKLAEAAEERNHHPFITIQYKLVIVELTSWSENGLTDWTLKWPISMKSSIRKWCNQKRRSQAAVSFVHRTLFQILITHT